MFMRYWQWLLLGLASLTGVLLMAMIFIGRKCCPKTENTITLEETEGPPGDKEMSFWEHLGELRARLLRMVIYWIMGSSAGWVYYNSIWKLLVKPIEPALQKFHIDVAFQSIFEPLMLKLQISLATGLVIAFPFILYEVMAFIWPALYRHEKIFALKLVPASLLLFSAGVYLAYRLIPFAALMMLQLGTPSDSEVVILNFARLYMWSVAKIAAACGLVFQMPLVMMFLGRLGLVSATGLLRYWRHAIVAIFALAAIITPTIDPINMSLLAGPIVGLYFLSVLLVAFTQRQYREAS